MSQRLCWLLPALTVSWMSLQLGMALPAHKEYSHVSADTFDPRGYDNILGVPSYVYSTATSTIIRQNHDGRAHHPPNGKNETQSSHKLVASPAGLLRPDKFQFYTYDDKGDMITRQMTAQEIQGLIASGGADHIAMDRQEPQKADDVLTGGKKVMDVVQKVQNVLKSALDKPPTVTGSIPKIPEHANVEWSNILPSILSGETDSIPPNSDSSQLSHKVTTEKIEAESTSKHPTKKPATLDVQTNAYAGFTNNVQGKPHQGHHPQETAATEKPMIPVPVITLTEQKLSTLQSAVTESPVFQIVSVIPVESAGIKESQTDPSTADSSAASSTIQLSAQTEESQTEQYIELTLSEVPEETTFPQLTSLNMYPVSITKQTTTNTTNSKVSQGMETSATYSMTTPGVSMHSSSTKQTVTHSGSSELTTDKISPSNASYILILSKNNTKVSDDSSFASSVTKESQTNGTYNDIIIPQTNTLATLVPISHASPKPEEASNALHSPSTLASVTRIKVPTVSTLHHYLSEGFSTVTKESSSPVTSTYFNPLPTDIQSSIEPLPTQLIDSFSSVINQVSEVKPPVLPLSSPSNETPEIPIMNINYEQRRNVSEVNEKNIRPIINTQTYATFTTEIPLRDTTTKFDYSITYRPVNTVDRESSTSSISENSRIKATTSIRVGTTSDRITSNNLPTTPTGLKSTQIHVEVSGSTAASSFVQLEKTHATAASLPISQTESPTTLGSITERIISEKTSTTSFLNLTDTKAVASDTTKTQSTTASIDTNLSSNKPTTTNENFDNTLANLNLSDPVSAIDKVISIVPLPSSTPTIKPIDLPDNISSFVGEIAGDIASGLIAGFPTTNVSNLSIIEKEKIENVTELHETERNVTQSTQEILTDPVRNGTLIYSTSTQIKESSDTLEPIKLLSSNERIDDSTKASLSSPANKFTNVNGESKVAIKQNATTVGIVSVIPEQTTTTTTTTTIDVGIRSPGVNKTTLNTNNNQKKTEIKEKIKPTEAPIVRTDLSPELSNQLSVKVANDTKNSGHVESSPKIEALNEKNGSFANASSIMKETVVLHSINDSSSESSSQAYSDVTMDISVLNVTSDAIVSNRNSTDPAFSQNSNHVTSTAGYKNKDNIQSKEDNKNNESSSVSIKEHTNSSIKITQDSTNDANVNKENISRLPDNPVNNTSSQIDKNVTQTTSTANASIQNDEDSNNTESKTASLKHSESSPKPDVIRLQASTSPSSVPVRQTSRPDYKPSEKPDVTKTDADVNAEDKWTLISQQASLAISKLPKPPKLPKPLQRKPVNHAQTSIPPSNSNSNDSIHVRSPGVEAPAHQQEQSQSSTQFLPLDASQSGSGLDATIRHTSADIVNFAKLCNELAFNFWVATNKGLSTARSLALSPFGMTSLLAMIFLGARGPTSDQMNEVLGLDDVATFNPHLVFQNITDAVGLARGQGIANAAFVRELFADKMKVRKLMPFYKEQAQQFYEGLVTEVNFATISDLVRRRTNLLVRKQTGGRIKDFVKTNTVPLRSPLAALSANVFQTDCNSSLTSSVGRDGELYFAVSPAVRQRKLVPVPATTWRSGVLAGYEPSIDATAIALGGSDKLVSTIFVLPGQQGHTAPGDTLDRLEQRLVRSAFRDGAWNKLLKVLIPRHGLELQVPKFSHRSVVNATAALKRMGLDELFSGNADFKGINGVGHRLYLADVLQMNLFSTCGDENILNGRHHVETYPASPLRRNVERRTEDDNFGNTAEENTMRYGTLPQEDNIDSYTDQSRTVLYGFYREERQLSGSLEKSRLKLDRPFLYFVRHNLSGIILHMGRFNPRLLP